MFTFRKARRIFEKIRKPDRSKKGENALQRIRNMLNKYETPITLALLFLWDDYNIDEETADEVMSGNESVEDVHAPFDSNLRDFENETLTPTLEHVGEERFETAYEDNKDLISINTEISDDDNANNEDSQFDYSAFYTKWCDERAGNLIANINDTQRENVKSIINTALQQGDTPYFAARRIKDTVGLTERQLNQNTRYYENMRNTLRENNPKLTDYEINSRAAKAARRMADKQRAKRAKDIARTEIVTAHNQANRAYIQWAIEHGYMQNVYRRWVTSNNDNVCPICVALNGQTVPFDKPYNVPSDIKYNGPEIMAPPVHTNCCCGEEFFTGDNNKIPSVPNKWDSMSEAEKKACVNYYADKSQYAEYKKQLGAENVPKTLEDFQKLKYNNKEEWDKLKAAYRATKSERSGYKYSTDGTFIATNHRKGGSVPRQLKPYAVLDLEKSDGHIERTIYDKDGYMVKQIHPTDHGNPKQHPYGKNGEHIHTYKWKDGTLEERRTRDITDSERKVNGDIL